MSCTIISHVLVDRNLLLYLLRLAVFVIIEADRPGAWFSGQLDPYQALFPGSCLNRDLKHAKMPVNPMKTAFYFGVFWGVIFKKIYYAIRQPNHVKHLLSGLYNLLIYNFHSLRSPPGDPRVAHCRKFSVRILPRFFFFPFTGISARGPLGRSDTALRPDSNLLAPYQAWFPGICLISEGKTTKKSILLCPPSYRVDRNLALYQARGGIAGLIFS